MNDTIETRWEQQNEAGRLSFTDGDFARAEQSFLAAIREATQLGADNVRLASSLSNLGQLKYKQKDFAQAEALFHRALAIRERVLGPEHFGLVQNINNLAALHYARGELDQAEPLFQRALGISEQHLGESHPDVAVTLNNLARLYFRKNEFASAGSAARAAALDQGAGARRQPSGDRGDSDESRESAAASAGLRRRRGVRASRARDSREAEAAERSRRRDRARDDRRDQWRAWTCRRGDSYRERALEVRTGAMGVDHPVIVAARAALEARRARRSGGHARAGCSSRCAAPAPSRTVRSSTHLPSSHPPVVQAPVVQAPVASPPSLHHRCTPARRRRPRSSSQPPRHRAARQPPAAPPTMRPPVVRAAVVRRFATSRAHHALDIAPLDRGHRNAASIARARAPRATAAPTARSPIPVHNGNGMVGSANGARPPAHRWNRRSHSIRLPNRRRRRARPRPRRRAPRRCSIARPKSTRARRAHSRTPSRDSSPKRRPVATPSWTMRRLRRRRIAFRSRVRRSASTGRSSRGVRGSRSSARSQCSARLRAAVGTSSRATNRRPSRRLRQRAAPVPKAKPIVAAKTDTLLVRHDSAPPGPPASVVKPGVTSAIIPTAKPAATPAPAPAATRTTKVLRPMRSTRHTSAREIRAGGIGWRADRRAHASVDQGRCDHEHDRRQRASSRGLGRERDAAKGAGLQAQNVQAAGVNSFGANLSICTSAFYCSCRCS